VKDDFACSPSPAQSVTADDMALALRHARKLQDLIPGILQVETGQNLSPNHRGYTYGFIMQFANEEALKAYATHPEHQPVSQELQSLCESIIDFDIPVGV
jgi:antibiotic biosynthesis monooxygenase (ABM) superfamily enzyme